jgi:WD40 repeat protein/serine/threonine protein kinase
MSGDLTCPHGHARPADGAAPPDCPACGAAAPPAATVNLRQPPPAAPPGTRTTEQTPVPPGPAAPGQPLPDVPGYEILAELGRGGMGVVYKARQKGLNRTVALKMIGAGPAANRDALARFRGEAEAIARLRQPNIIQVYEVGSCAAGPYFAMEYAEGGSLAEHWAGTPQPARAAAQTVAALAVAVQAAHEHGIVHRDLKPANILLARVSGSQTPGKDGKRPAAEGERPPERELVPKISDFGLARWLDDPRGLTLTGQVMGTPGYMAPEQARGGGHDVGPAADVYALGVLLYEALTGGPPYRGVSALESVHLMLSEELLPPSRLRPGLPRDLETVCLHCLQREPHKRYASAGELAADMERFLSGEPIRARPTPPWERAWKWSRRHPATAGLAAALGTTVAVTFTLVLGQWRRAEDERRLADDARRGALQSAAAERKERHRAQVLSVDLMLERGVGLCETGEYGPGLLWLARALDAAPADDPGLKRAARLLLDGWGRQLRVPLAVFPHDGKVAAAALSPDGKVVAAAARDRVYLWKDGGCGPCAAPLVHGARVTAVAFSPDGVTLLTASADGSARLFDAATGRPRGNPLRHGGAVQIALFGPDGKRVLTAGSDGTARLWDAATGDARGGPLRHGGAVLAAAFAPDGQLIATACADGAARVWEAATGRELVGPLPHGGAATAVAFAPGGQTLATGSVDAQVRLWDVATGRLLWRLGEHAAPVRALAFSPDGRTLATGGDDRKGILWDLATGTARARLVHQEAVRLVAFSPGGKAVATGAGDSTARLWAADSGRPLGGPLPHGGDLTAVAFGPGGRTLLTAGDDGLVRLWPTDPPGVVEAPLALGAPVRCLVPAPDGRTALVCDDTGATRLGDLRAGTHRVVADGSRATTVALVPGGEGFVTAGFDRSVRFWRTADSAPDGPPLETGSVALAAAVSPDGGFVAAGFDDGEGPLLRVWDRTRGAVRCTMTGHLRKVVAVAFSPDGRRVASASWDKTARLWDAAAGSPVGEPLRHQDLVRAVAFAPDGKAVLTGGDDYSARLWDAATGMPLLPPLRHGEKVAAVEVSPDGSVLLTVGNGGTARLWERVTGKPLGPPVPYRGGLSAGAFAPDGRSFLTGGREGVVRRWSVPVPLEGDADRVWLWLHVRTGLRLDAAGAAVPVEPRAYYDAFARWKRSG